MDLKLAENLKVFELNDNTSDLTESIEDDLDVTDPDDEFDDIASDE